MRTPYLALGYLGDPGLTAERFLTNDAGDRLYKTGDRVPFNATFTLKSVASGKYLTAGANPRLFFSSTASLFSMQP